MNNNSINRRQFLCTSMKTAGAALLLGLLPSGWQDVAASDDLIIDSFRPESTLIVDMLAKAGKRRAEFADIFLEQSVTRQFKFVNGKLEDSLFSITEGVAIRAMNSTKSAFTTTDSFRLDDVRDAAKKARKQLESTQYDFKVKKLSKFPSMEFGTIVTRKKLSQTSDNEMLKALQNLLKNNPPSSNLISKTETISKDTIRRIIAANSQGVFIMDSQPSIDITFNHTATIGSTKRTATGQQGHRCGLEFLYNDSLRKLLYHTSSRAVEALSVKPVPNGNWPLLLAPRAAASIAEIWIHALLSTPQSEQPPSPDHLSLIDSGIVKNARGSSQYDDEGSNTSRTLLVNQGKHSASLNMRDHRPIRMAALSGNARRASFQLPPEISPTNTYIKTSRPVENLTLADLGTGLVIDEMRPVNPQGNQQKISFHVTSGWWVKDGKRIHPVDNCIVTTSLPALLNKIESMEEHPIFFSNTFGSSKIHVSYGAPALLLSNLPIRQL